MENWEEIHEDFKHEYCQNFWEQANFDYQATKEWVAVFRENFTVDDFAFCAWLRDKKQLTSSEIKQQNSLEAFRTEYKQLWIAGHQEFGKEAYKGSNETYQETWEKWGFTYSEALAWIAIGFIPEDYYLVKKWKNHHFTRLQTQTWKEIGLDKSDYELAAYSRGKNSPPNSELNLASLKTEFETWSRQNKLAQEYLAIIYPSIQRDTVTELYISQRNLVGDLDLSDFRSLEELNCEKNQLTSLNLSNCWELVKLDCAGNPNLTKLDLDNCQKLEYLTGNKNCLKTEWDGNKFPNLKRVYWSANAQAWLAENYPSNGVCFRETNDKLWSDYDDDEGGWNNQGKTRLQITKLDISGQELEGSLDLTGFANLKILNCSYNYLTELILPKNSRLEEIDCTDNNLSNPDFLINLVSLEILGLASNPNLTGSLVALRNCPKLWALGIHDTNMTPDWEYLSWKVKEIDRSYVSKEIWHVDKYQELPCPDHHNIHNLQLWRTNQSAYQNLKETLSKINPNLDLQELINKFDFFNVRTGEFQGDLNNLFFFFKLNEEETYFLKQTIADLISLIKKQNSKINEKLKKAYTYFVPQKELITKLLETHDKYFKAKKQGLKCSKLFDLYYESRKTLRDKIGEELMEEAEKVLNDCEELIELGLELEAKINNKLTIEYQQEKQNIYLFGNINVQEGHAIIGCQFKDNTDLSYHHKLIDSSQTKEKRTYSRRDSYKTEESFKKLSEERIVELMDIDNQKQIVEQLEEELAMKREEAAKALEKAKEWRERQIKEITEQKDKEIEQLKTKIAELEQQKQQVETQIQILPK